MRSLPSTTGQSHAIVSAPCENAGSLATRENSYFFAAPSHREMVDWTRGTLLCLRWSFEPCIVLKFQTSDPFSYRSVARSRTSVNHSSRPRLPSPCPPTACRCLYISPVLPTYTSGTLPLAFMQFLQAQYYELLFLYERAHSALSQVPGQSAGTRRARPDVRLQEFTESIEPGIKPTRLVSQRGFALNELLRRLDDFGSLHRYCRRD